MYPQTSLVTLARCTPFWLYPPLPHNPPLPPPCRDFTPKPLDTLTAASVALAKVCMEAQVELAMVISGSGHAAQLVTKYRWVWPAQEHGREGRRVGGMALWVLSLMS